jgi:hypothetical protein
VVTNGLSRKTDASPLFCRVRDERWPEVVAVQDMLQNQAHILAAPGGWRTRLMNRLLP